MSARVRSRPLPTSLVLAVAMVCAGIAYPVTGVALEHTTALTIAAVRAVVGGVLLTAALPLLGARLPRTRRLWAMAAVIGLLSTTLTQVGISVGTDRAGAAVASVLTNSAPFYVALMARGFLAEPISRLRLLGLLIGFGGVLAVVLADPGDVSAGTALAIGLALSIVGALGWAGGGLVMRALAQRTPDLDVVGLTAAQFLCGGVPLLPLVLLEGGSTAWSRGSLLGGLAFLVMGGQVVVYLGFNVALARWDSTRVYAWTFLVPAIAVLVEAVRGNLPSGVGVGGIVLVIVGVAVVNHPAAAR